MQRRHSQLRGLAVVLAVVCGSGCRRTHSPEFFEAQSRYATLVAELGDGAYSDPGMEEVVSGLGRVSKRRFEFEAAQQLLTKIREESARAAAKRSALEDLDRKLAAPAAPAGGALSRLPPWSATEAGDAGSAVERPLPGMAEADFRAKYGRCFGEPRAVKLPGEVEASVAYPLLGSADCAKQFGANTFSYVFNQHKLTGTMTELRAPNAADAGAPLSAPLPAPVTRAQPDAPEAAPAPPAAANPYDGTPRGQVNPYDGTPRPPPSSER
jgi:hypothetical protein